MPCRTRWSMKICLEKNMKNTFQLHPIGRIRKKGNSIAIKIDPLYSDAMLGMESFSHIQVLYWFHENDDPESRNTLQVRPRKNPQNPVTGVFATHAPVRPNLIAVSTCRVESIANNIIEVDDIDARDGSPVIDIKCYFPPKEPLKNIHLPEWI